MKGLGQFYGFGQSVNDDFTTWLCIFRRTNSRGIRTKLPWKIPTLTKKKKRKKNGRRLLICSKFLACFVFLCFVCHIEIQLKQSKYLLFKSNDDAVWNWDYISSFGAYALLRRSSGPLIEFATCRLINFRLCWKGQGVWLPIKMKDRLHESRGGAELEESKEQGLT